jgi:cell division protein FtsQ
LLLVKTPLNVSATALVEAAAVVSALPSDIAIRVHLIEVVTPDDITLDVSGGVTVLWGSAADSDNKAKVLRVLLKKHVTQIDVSVPGRPTAR